jgi:ankyrin repeat protein
MDIVQLMLDKGADPNEGLWGAAWGGHMDIVQFMLSKGATNLDSALNAAENLGNTKCAELIRAAMKK